MEEHDIGFVERHRGAAIRHLALLTEVRGGARHEQPLGVVMEVRQFGILDKRVGMEEDGGRDLDHRCLVGRALAATRTRAQKERAQKRQHTAYKPCTAYALRSAYFTNQTAIRDMGGG